MSTTDGGARGDVPLTARIGRPALGALAHVGVTTLQEVSRRSEAELLALHGVGPRAVRLLREALAAEGLTLRDDG
ncbi:hypothetical protein [Cellulomonas cellasea]|uniref:DNA-binding protein n=2 Tax=Cellulomonas cellasea TaxID=43670 RepID=A0A0A0BCI7_9CELL|nr:hypothetical protein [Cellulomonas cellasea]KGM03594.1 hypothetical protein Q760_00405 [Cellulomonas cellasea DSM 20118]GEA87490.1 hypothetical protein CCE01nite_14390 [Cellulomonas cellasea]